MQNQGLKNSLKDMFLHQLKLKPKWSNKKKPNFNQIKKSIKQKPINLLILFLMKKMNSSRRIMRMMKIKKILKKIKKLFPTRLKNMTHSQVKKLHMTLKEVLSKAQHSKKKKKRLMNKVMSRVMKSLMKKVKHKKKLRKNKKNQSSLSILMRSSMSFFKRKLEKMVTLKIQSNRVQTTHQLKMIAHQIYQKIQILNMQIIQDL